MLYKGEEIRLEVGDIILYRNEFRLFEPITWLSKAIRWFTKFGYNHAAVVVEMDGVLMIIEALAPGIIIRPAEKFLERTHSEILILSPKEEIDKVKFNEKAIHALGTKYDYNFTVVAQGWWRLRLMLNKDAKYTGHTKLFADKTFACAEFAAWCYDLPDWWKAAPKELYESDKLTVTYAEKYK